MNAWPALHQEVDIHAVVMSLLYPTLQVRCLDTGVSASQRPYRSGHEVQMPYGVHDSSGERSRHSLWDLPSVLLPLAVPLSHLTKYVTFLAPSHHRYA